MNINSNNKLIEYIPLQQGLRPTSFKFTFFVHILIEYIPLQQGLRQELVEPGIVKISTHWVYSITTRIKTTATRPSGSMMILIEYIPLQQGLRLTKVICDLHNFMLIEYIPLQQGLRQPSLILIDKSMAHWVYSITTRIKTRRYPVLFVLSSLIEYIPLQQGLRHILFTEPLALVDSLSIFHYNKD